MPTVRETRRRRAAGAGAGKALSTRPPPPRGRPHLPPPPPGHRPRQEGRGSAHAPPRTCTTHLRGDLAPPPPAAPAQPARGDVSARAHVTPRPAAHDAGVTHGGLPGPRRARGVSRGRTRFRWRLPGRPGRALTRPGRGTRPRRSPSAAPPAPRPRSPRPQLAQLHGSCGAPGPGPPHPGPGGGPAAAQPARNQHRGRRLTRTPGRPMHGPALGPPGAPCTVRLVQTPGRPMQWAEAPMLVSTPAPALGPAGVGGGVEAEDLSLRDQPGGSRAGGASGVAGGAAARGKRETGNCGPESRSPVPGLHLPAVGPRTNCGGCLSLFLHL